MITMQTFVFLLLSTLSVCLANPQIVQRGKERLRELLGNQFIKSSPFQLNARIVNGNTVTDNTRWPWQVSLQRSGSHSCGGSIIGAKWILTAAHCVDGASASSLSIRAGTTKWARGGQTRNVASIAMASGYNPNQSGFPNDIAVLELTSDLSFSDSVQSIEMSTSRSDSLLSSECFITGWGMTSGTSSIPSDLQEAEIPVISDSSCRQSWGSSIYADLHVCLNGYNRGACMGDSGGPLVCKINNAWELVGATSWGSSSCSTSYPSVYAEVAQFKTVILNYINAN